MCALIITNTWIIARDRDGTERAQQVVLIQYERAGRPWFRAELELDERQCADTGKGPGHAVADLQERLSRRTT